MKVKAKAKANSGAPSTKKVRGIGRFATGIPDLGSNKKHLKGFGR